MGGKYKKIPQLHKFQKNSLKKKWISDTSTDLLDPNCKAASFTQLYGEIRKTGNEKKDCPLQTVSNDNISSSHENLFRQCIQSLAHRTGCQ